MKRILDHRHKQTQTNYTRIVNERERETERERERERDRDREMYLNKSVLYYFQDILFVPIEQMFHQLKKMVPGI